MSPTNRHSIIENICHPSDEHQSLNDVRHQNMNFQGLNQDQCRDHQNSYKFLHLKRRTLITVFKKNDPEKTNAAGNESKQRSATSVDGQKSRISEEDQFMTYEHPWACFKTSDRTIKNISIMEYNGASEYQVDFPRPQ